MPFVGARRLCPVFAHEAGDPLEFAEIACDDHQPMAACMIGDQQIVAADDPPLPFKVVLDVSSVMGGIVHLNQKRGR